MLVVTIQGRRSQITCSYQEPLPEGSYRIGAHLVARYSQVRYLQDLSISQEISISKNATVLSPAVFLLANALLVVIIRPLGQFKRRDT